MVMKKSSNSKFFRVLKITAIALCAVGFLIPQNFKMPVEGATKNSFHPKSYWFYPWGKSVVHKGVDIFAKHNTPIQSSTTGIVLSTGHLKRGGNYVLILGPKWRIHYYAHLRDIQTTTGTVVTHQTKIGTVGSSGNAKGKPPHLHYSIITLIPYPWRIDQTRQGWKKMFFLNPIDYM